MSKGNDFDNHSNSNILIYFGICMSLVIVLVLIVVTSGNNIKTSSPDGFKLAQEQALRRSGKEGTATETQTSQLQEKKLTSDELDIWTLPPTGRTEVATNNDTGTNSIIKENAQEPEQKEIQTIPLTTELLPTLFTPENFVRDGNKMSYLNDGKVSSTVGLELSWRQGNVNMKRLKNSGCDFVMLYLGQRGFASGKIVIDESFHKNLEAATSAGLKVGIIFKTQAIDKEEAIEEADVVLTAIRGYSISYPVFIEIEFDEDELARTDGLSKNDRTDLCTYFIDEIVEAGYKAGIYSDKTFFTEEIDLSEIPPCEIWLTQKNDYPDYEGEISFWQYDSGIFNGVTNETRFSIHFENP